MSSTQRVFLSRASNAFSSLAATVALAVLTILALALGTVQDSKADTSSGAKLLGITKVEDPSLEWNGTVTLAGLPARQAAAEKPQVISRQPLSTSRFASRGTQGPMQEWLGVSKLALPLLVGDLVGSQAVKAPAVMTGRTVGATK